MAILNFIETNHDWDKKKYTFKCKRLPIKMICDWGIDKKPNKKNGDESFMIREYYIFNLLIFKRKHTTITQIPGYKK